MTIKLSQEESQNIKVALIQLAKAQATPVDVMAYLLNLSNKFNYKEKDENKSNKKD